MKLAVGRQLVVALAWLFLGGTANAASNGTNERLPACLYDQARTVLVSGGVDNTFLRTRSVVAPLKSVNVSHQRFVVAWTAASSASGQDIFARIYIVASNVTVAETDEFRVNSQDALDQQSPQISTLPGGGFVVAWESIIVSPPDQASFIGRQRRLRFQIFDWKGSRLGDEQDVAADEGDFAHLDSRPSLSPIYVTTTGPGSRFAIAWLRTYFSFSNTGQSELDPYTELRVQRTSLPTSVTVVMTRMFLLDGRPLTTTSRVNVGFPFDDSAGVAGSVAVTTIQGDRFVVVWSDDTRCGGSRVYGQIFDGSDGDLLGSSFTISGSASADTEDHIDPAIISIRTGGFAVSWTVQENTGTSASTIRIQVFDATGAKRGRPFGVGSSSGVIQSASSMAAFTNGNFVATWNAFEDSGFRIYAQMFNSTYVGPSDPQLMVSSKSEGNSTDVQTSDSLPAIAILSGNQMVLTWNRNAVSIYVKVYTCARSCILSDWSPLSKCSAPCQEEGISFRSRDIVAESVLGGAECSLFPTAQYFPCVGDQCTETAGGTVGITSEGNINTTSSVIVPTLVPYQNIRRLHNNA